MRQRRTALALLVGMALLGGGSAVYAALRHSSPPATYRAPRVIVKPNPVPLGARIVVIMTGLRTGEQVQLEAHSSGAGIGGGTSGTHRVGKDGTIVFSDPTFTQRLKPGTWIITAHRPNDATFQTRLQVIASLRAPGSGILRSRG